MERNLEEDRARLAKLERMNPGERRTWLVTDLKTVLETIPARTRSTSLILQLLEARLARAHAFEIIELRHRKLHGEPALKPFPAIERTLTDYDIDYLRMSTGVLDRLDRR